MLLCYLYPEYSNCLARIIEFHGVKTYRCRDGNLLPERHWLYRQIALSLSQNEQREDARTKQSSRARARERASWSIIPHALSARDAWHRRRTFPRDIRNVSTKISSGIMVAGFPIYFCLVKSLSYTYMIDTAKNSYFIIYYLFLPRYFVFPSFHSSYTPLRFSRIHSIQPITVLWCTSGLSWPLNMYVGIRETRARTSKEPFSSRCNFVSIELRMHSGCYLSIRQLVAWVISSRVQMIRLC